MTLRRSRALASLTAAVALTGCGRGELDVSKEDERISYFTASNFDLCLTNAASCLEVMETGDLASVSDGVRLVKLEPTAKVFRPVEASRIRKADLKTLEGSSFFTTLMTISSARKQASKAGFAVPPRVNVDAYCNMPFSDNNAYFRNAYGFDSENGETKLQKVICLGLFFDGQRLVGLGNDRFVVAHEFFHAIVAQGILGADNTIPEEALTYSHDLDSYNEGAADFFAEKTTGSGLSRIFGVLLPWRTATGRKAQGPGTYANIYRDGTRYTELLSRIDTVTPALPVLACSVKELGSAIRRAKRDAESKKIYYAFDVNAVDILDSMVRCSPEAQRTKVAAAVAAVFPSPSSAEVKARSAKLDVVLVPTQRSLCGLQRIYGLSPTDLRKYHFLDACAGSFQASWQGNAPLKMAREEIDEYAVERRKFEAIYVLPGIHVNGRAADCRLRGLTNITTPEVALTTAVAPGKIGTRFHNVIFRPLLRGSWYRDVAFGDFMGAETAPFDLQGPFRPLTVGEKPIRFVGAPTQDGRPTTGMNGYWWLPITDLAVQTRTEKHAALARWTKETLSPYQVDPVTNLACTEGGPCVTVQNYDLVCRSHSSPMTASNPQPGKFEPVSFESINVHVFDCVGDERTCKLETF